MGDNVHRDYSFDFIRALCAIGIIMFHFSIHLENGGFILFLTTVNVDWGAI